MAARDGADIVAFSELFIAGYPPEDLVLKPAFQAACRAAVEALARDTGDGGPAVLIGTPWRRRRQALQCLCAARRRADRYRPLQGEPAELRRVRRKARVRDRPGAGTGEFSRRPDGLPICEDTWTDWGDYENVVECLPRPAPRFCSCRTARRTGATRPMSASTSRWRASPKSGLPLLYINQFGGQDELVFDGASFALNADRSIAFQLPAFAKRSSRRNGRARPGWRCAQGPMAGRRPTMPTTPPAWLGFATMSRRTVSKVSCSACPVASIRRCVRRSPSMRSAPRACAASCCPTATRRRSCLTTPPRSRRRWVCVTT